MVMIIIFIFVAGFFMQREYLFQFGINYAKDPFYRDIKRPIPDWRRASADLQRRQAVDRRCDPVSRWI